MEKRAIAAEELTKFYGKARGIDHLNLSVGEVHHDPDAAGADLSGLRKGTGAGTGHREG